MTGNGHPSVHVNRLIHEKSPYLLQHAHNPVDWYPWGTEAFERAVRDNKPIFLSIGYSTCHWCHVMAHESFEDPETATLLNREFICIKVDREERPDIDQIYMMVCQVMTGHGGWPLTILMTAERRPFFAATYLPRHTLPGIPGLLEILPRLVEVWKNQKEDLERYSQDIVEVLKQESREMASRSEPDLPLLKHACQRLEREYDPRNGGFGTAPKFPMPQYLLFLLRIWERTGDAHALSMVEKTLQEMRKGGIYDQVGYGVHRYSVDEGWRIPHFEKTLYDQALLALAELETYQATRDPQYARTAREIFSYVLQDLSAENGGFYSGEDADSEGVEGGFYLWRWEELESILGTSDLQLLSQFYGLRKEGNLSLSLQGAPVDANLLYQERSLSEVARETGIPADDLASRLEHLRAILQNLRSERARPARDTKILGDWNGLMIAALALGGRVLEDTRFTQAAQDAEKAVIALLQRPDGRLNHVHSGDISYVDAFSADYAALAFAEIELYETTFAPHHLERALELMHQLTVWYRDTDRGGYYVTPSDGELILVRKQEVYDGAYPSANSLALYNLLRLASLTGSSVYRDQAIQDWESCSGLVETSPLGFMFLLLSVDYLVGPTRQLVITGDGSPRAQEMIRALAGAFLPRLTVHLVTGKEKGGRLPDLAPFLSSYTVSDETRAFVCCGDRCLSPAPDTEQMMEYLNACK